MEEKNTMNSKMVTDYGSEKFSKEKELNSSMSIKNNSPDEYTNTIKNIGGNR